MVESRTAVTLTVTWAAPDVGTFTGYKVTAREGVNVKTETPSKDATSVVMTGLTAGTEYSVEIVTVNNLDESSVLTDTASTCKSPFYVFVS